MYGLYKACGKIVVPFGQKKFFYWCIGAIHFVFFSGRENLCVRYLLCLFGGGFLWVVHLVIRISFRMPHGSLLGCYNETGVWEYLLCPPERKYGCRSLHTACTQPILTEWIALGERKTYLLVKSTKQYGETQKRVVYALPMIAYTIFLYPQRNSGKGNKLPISTPCRNKKTV